MKDCNALETENGEAVVMQNLMTIKQFAEILQITPDLARQRCNSRTFRENKIARREGRDWKIDFDKYRKVVWGDSEIKQK